MSFTSIAAFLSTILAIYCTIPYVQAILKRKTKPHQLSWLVFTIMNGIVFFSQYFAGGRDSVLIALTFFIGSLIIFLLSLKFGIRESSRWDKVLFLFALCTIGLWVVTKNNVLAIWLTVLIDIAATAMTVLKIKTDPESEAALPWGIAAVAYIFTILTLFGQPLNILYVRPLYGFLSDIVLIAAIYFFKPKTKKKFF